MHMGFMNNHLSQTNQRTKITEFSSLCDQIIFGVPKSSVLRPFLFKIFLSDLFLILNDIDIASDAYDITLYKECHNVDTKELFKMV